MKKIIVFDFDKTLTYEDTILPFFKFVAKKNISYPIKLGIYYIFMILAKFNIVSNFTLKNIGIKIFLKNIKESELREKCLEFSKKINLNKLFKEMSFNEESCSYFVITASFEDYVKPVFPFNVKVIGSKMKLEKDYPKGLLFNCYGKEKLKALQNLNINKIDILYTDSLNDIWLAKISKKIYIIKQDEKILCNGVEEFLRYFNNEHTNF